MLKDEDRIFTNLYNDLGPDILSAQKKHITKSYKPLSTISGTHSRYQKSNSKVTI